MTSADAHLSSLNIGFIGLGNMGLPMACNLVKAGHHVEGYDVVAQNVAELKSKGGIGVRSIAQAVNDADVVILMLPAGEFVREVLIGNEGVFATAKSGALIIDSSTIDVTTARLMAKEAEEFGLSMLDAPVSGGIMGAKAGTLTFMCGGSDAAFARANPVLEIMGANIIHAGGAGNGQAAKLCNNMLLGISMIGVSEAFNLADALGLERQKLFDISSTASGQCWSLTTYCPVPGPVPTSPANNDYQPGFSVAMMLKDLKLAEDAATSTKTNTPLGQRAAGLYEAFDASGNSGVDFSRIIEFLRGQKL